MSALQQNLPLSAITAIDLSHVYNGPSATFLMAMVGAEARSFAICFSTADGDEGVKAFLEKRKPVFTGR